MPSPSGFLTDSGCGFHNVYCTVIHSQVVSCQPAQLHEGCAGGYVHRQGQPALEVLCSFGLIILRVNPAHTLRSLTRPLPHPVHIAVGEGEPRGLAGHLH
jgi:hypothetical protein